jgi:solute carrier family 35 protein C2
MSDSVVTRWLQDQNYTSRSAAPDSLHPADEFPLRTFSNPPLSSLSSSDPDNSDSGDGHHPQARRPAAAALIHPPTPNMDEHPPAPLNSARRRSSSLAGAPVTANQPPRKHRRNTSEYIPEEGEDVSESDKEHSDSAEHSESAGSDDMRSQDGLEDDEETGLTRGDRRRRRRRKRRNTHLDQRIIEDANYKEQEKLANQNLVRSMLINAVLIGLWYGCFSQLASTYTSILTSPGTCSPFRYPCTTSGCSS